MVKTLRFVALIAAMLLPIGAFGAAAVVTNMSGVLTVLKADGSVKILTPKSEVEAGDTLSTEKDSFARIKFSDGGEVTLRPNSRIKIDEYGFDENAPEKDNFAFSLIKGGLRTITGLVGKRGNREAYRLQTVVATIGIRGTNYGATMCQGDCASHLSDGLYLNVSSGAIATINSGGELTLGAGQFGFVGGINTQPVMLPKDPGLPPDQVSNKKGAKEEGQDKSGTAGAGCYVN